MIEVSNLTKRYGSKVAVDNLSFTVNQGEILGFLGLNGAGKTTTMNILTGYLSASQGACKVNGFDVLENPIEAKRSIGYLPEQPPLYLDMTVKEYLNFIYDLKNVKLPREQHIKEVCGVVKIENVYHRIIKNLSKGYKQRVGLAQALVGNPKVLVLDEPTVGLDPKQIIEIRNLIRSLGEKHTVILSSHILPEVQAVCDRVIVINNGRLVADDTATNLSKNMSTDRHYTILIDGPEAEVYKSLKGITGMLSVDTLGNREKGVYEYQVESDESVDIRREIFKRLAERNWPLLGMRSSELTLEQIFLQLTGEGSHPLQESSSKNKMSGKIELLDATDEENEENEASEENDAEIANETNDLSTAAEKEQKPEGGEK